MRIAQVILHGIAFVAFAAQGNWPACVWVVVATFWMMAAIEEGK